MLKWCKFGKVKSIFLAWVFLLAAFTVRSQPQLELKIFLAVDCPISQKYIARLNELHARYPQVQMKGVISGKAESERAEGFSKEYNISFPLIKDIAYGAARQYHAKITPEAVLLNENRLVYQGAIDNWFYALGRYRKTTTEHYVVDAIESSLRGEEPKIKKTEAIGCFLQMPDSEKKKNHH